MRQLKMKSAQEELLMPYFPAKFVGATLTKITCLRINRTAVAVSGSRCGRVLVEDVGDRRHRGQRGAQLVRDVGGEAAGARLHAAQFGHGLLQGGGGLVEGVGEVGEFVGAVDGEPGVQVALGDAAGGPPQFAYRPQHAAGGQQREQYGQDQRGHGGPFDGRDQGLDVGRLARSEGPSEIRRGRTVRRCAPVRCRR